LRVKVAQNPELSGHEMRLALYQPDIPQNTGTLVRLAACLGVPIALIGPAGFDFSDRAFRRAGLDYFEEAEIARHASFEAFEAWRHALSPRPRLVLLTTQAARVHVDFAFHASDILLLGRESAGVPQTVHDNADARVRIPMRTGVRSLNIAVAAAMVLGEALRQTDGYPEQ
jgi:tRNA (cytidine/uridine-2'-O-)-methyltransferase